MKFFKLKKLIKKSYLPAIMSLFFIGVTMVPGTTNVHASDTWSVTLPSATRTAAGRSNYTRHGNWKANISLTRIVNGPSYYVKAQMVNSNGSARTGRIYVQQNAGLKNFTNVTMTDGYDYTLWVSNSYFETRARSAYGYINI